MLRSAALVLALAVSLSARAAIFIVDDDGDGGDANTANGVCATATNTCTLRAALQQANALAGTDTIQFGLAADELVIQPATPLPVSSNMLIDGTTQLGVGAGPFVLIDGQNATTVGFDFTVSGLTVTIHGLAIGGFTEAGIKTWQSGAAVTVKRCHIGVDRDGVTPLPNGDGILVRVTSTGAGTVIVGDASGGGNVISGNLDMGIDVVDGSQNGAKLDVFTVQGNRIGLASDGMTAVPNASGGIRVNGQFGTVTVGGSIAGRNLISGNNGGGYITAAFFQADLIQFSHNYVGVAQDGVTVRANNGTGVRLAARAYDIRSNVIASNQGHGLALNSGNLASSILANRITDNGGHGIHISSNQNLIAIGGPGSDANTITGNGQDGIAVVSSGNAEIAENVISSNGGLGIDLEDDGVSANDAGDADTGGNDRQNYPVLSSAVNAGGITFVSGSLSSAASTSYTIRFFSSPAADPSGFGEGETYLGTTTVTTSAGGTASFTFQCPALLGTYITATATHATSGTSEFSNAALVTGPPQFRMSTASEATAESGNVTLTIQRVNGATGAASVQWTTIPGSAGASDFTPASGTASFGSGETSKTIAIAITPDALDETDESFNVQLSNPSTGTELGSPSQTTVTITDDDAQPSISIGDAPGNENVTPRTLDVTLSAPSGRTITVDFLTTNGSAAAGSDYTATSGTLTFLPGEITKTISVPIVNDADIELDETFTVTLSNPSNATIADGAATGTITNDDGQPSITIDDVAVVEGDTATFTVTLSAPTAMTVTAGWSTSDGTAAAGDDYTSDSGTVMFVPGDLTETIAIAIGEDTIVENGETFFVDLAGPANATLADAQGGGTIADDDGTPSLSINDPAVVEGVNATFTVTLAPASALPVTVTYATSDGTASDPGDYSGATNTLTFAAGETSKTIDVATSADAIAESSEAFTMTLSSPSGATLADGSATGTILDDDGEPRVSIGNASETEGTTLVFTVDLSHASASTVSVDYAISDGSATSGDYTAAGGTLMFAPGDTSRTISVLVASDTLVESDETLFVTLDNAANAIVIDAQATGTIVNDDGSVAVSIAGISATEGTALAFDVTLSAATSDAVTVPWTTANGSAIAGSDYTAASGSVVFAPGDTAETITITTSADATFEPDETLLVNLLGATNATLADAQATGTILNDDPAPAVPSISISSPSVSEGNAGTVALVFDVTLNVATVNGVTVDYATGGGSADAATDYVATGGTLSFAPGMTTQSVTIAVVGDTLVEGNETLLVTLSSPSNATLGSSTGTGTIVDDDVAPAVPSISIANASAVEGHVGSTPMTFTVALDVATVSTVTVDYATGAGSATAGVDYATANGTLTFAPGVTSQIVAVPVIGDPLVETNETLVVTLSSPSNATLGNASATGTIFDDDSAPVVPAISIADVAQFEGDAGATLFAFPVTLNVATTLPVSVAWSATGSPSDVVAANGTLVFAPGMATQTIHVAVHGDEAVEGDETFTVTLSGPSNATLADPTATGTIRNDDQRAPAIPSLRASAVTVTEGDEGATGVVLTLTLSSRRDGASVRWMTRGGTATPGADFVEASGRATFHGTTATIELTVVGDRVDENAESFVVELFDPEGATLRDERAEIAIVDDDVSPQPHGIVLVVGSVHGNSGSRFGTAVQMVNFSDEPAAGALQLIPAGTTGPATSIPYALAPRELRVFEDLLPELGLGGLATLDVTATAGPLPRMSIRIFDDGSGHGTTGFTLPVVTPDDALRAGDSGLLFPPDDPHAMRFNVGIRTLDEGAAMTVEVRDRTGAIVHTVPREYAASWFLQLSGADFTGTELRAGDYIAIRVTRGAAILYGASVDNVTNDPSVHVVTR